MEVLGLFPAWLQDPAGVISRLSEGNPLPGSEEGFSAEAPIQPQLQPEHGNQAG